jgi:uncharacterized metal-binding protein
MNFTCAECAVMACVSGEKDKMPKNCPMQQKKAYEEIEAIYKEPQLKKFYEETLYTKSDWNRVREIVEFCRRMGYKRIGVAFCQGLKKETKVFCDIMRKRGFSVVSVVCRNGGYTKQEILEQGENPDHFVSVCNPVGQAKFLAESEVDFIVEIGLCVGHDSIFLKEIAKRSDAMVTVLIAKDRATGHNPCAVLYGADGFFRKRLGDPA